jgi:hypothetical protein
VVNHFKPISFWKHAAIITALAAFIATSCGAPVESAEDVAPLFADSQTLGDKMTELCNTVGQRPQEPNLSGLDFGAAECANAGYQSQDLVGLREIAFSSISSAPLKASTDGGRDSFRLQTRVELWMNRPLLKIVRIILPRLKERSDSLASSGSQATSAQDQTKFKVKVIDKPVFDKEKLSLSMQFELESKKADNGFIDVLNRFTVKGELVDKKYIFATVTTSQDASVDASLLKRAKVAVFVIPHAKDIYIDIVSDVEFHSFGVDEVMKREIIKIFGKAMKSIPDLLNEAESKVQ